MEDDILLSLASLSTTRCDNFLGLIAFSLDENEFLGPFSGASVDQELLELLGCANEVEVEFESMERKADSEPDPELEDGETREECEERSSGRESRSIRGDRTDSGWSTSMACG